MLQLQSLLGPHVVLVGQGPKGDAEWMGLEAGVHYKVHTMTTL